MWVDVGWILSVIYLEGIALTCTCDGLTLIYLGRVSGSLIYLGRVAGSLIYLGRVAGSLIYLDRGCWSKPGRFHTPLMCSGMRH